MEAPHLIRPPRRSGAPLWLPLSQALAVAALLPGCDGRVAPAPGAQDLVATPQTKLGAPSQAVTGSGAGRTGGRLDLNQLIFEDARGIDLIPGTWASDAAECASEFAIVFDQQTYRDHAGSGPWWAEGDVIVIDYRTDPRPGDGLVLTSEIRLKVFALSPDRVVWQDRNAQQQTLFLCQ